MAKAINGFRGALVILIPQATEKAVNELLAFVNENDFHKLSLDALLTELYCKTLTLKDFAHYRLDPLKAYDGFHCLTASINHTFSLIDRPVELLYSKETVYAAPYSFSYRLGRLRSETEDAYRLELPSGDFRTFDKAKARIRLSLVEPKVGMRPHRIKLLWSQSGTLSAYRLEHG